MTDLRCPPSVLVAPLDRGGSILALASDLNAAIIEYRAAVDKPMGYSDTLARIGAVARIGDELVSAIATAVAEQLDVS